MLSLFFPQLYDIVHSVFTPAVFIVHSIVLSFLSTVNDLKLRTLIAAVNDLKLRTLIAG